MAHSRPDTLKLAEQIAPFLNGWRFNRVLSAEKDSWRPVAVFSNAHHQTFSISTDWRNEKRLKACGKDSRHTIGFSVDRNPKAIAADIERRFLPQYLADLGEHSQRRAKDAEGKELFRQKMAILEAALGPVIANHHSSEHHFNNASVRFGGYRTELDITFKVSFDNAVKLAYFFKSLNIPTLED